MNVVSRVTTLYWHNAGWPLSL